MKKLLLLFLVLVRVGVAQQSTIDGSTNPAGIPDEAAARAVFSVHSMFGAPADIVNSAKQRDKIGFSVTEPRHLRRRHASSLQRDSVQQPSSPGRHVEQSGPDALRRWTGQAEEVHSRRKKEHAVSHAKTDIAEGSDTMKLLRLSLFLLSLSLVATAQGAYTLYYSDTDIVNADGSVTLTPTVSLSGNDGNFCAVAFDYFETQEIPAVMLNGNTWSYGSKQVGGGTPLWPDGTIYINFVHTFPSVTLPANGNAVDMSYAGKVMANCADITEGGAPMGNPNNTFYGLQFVDGMVSSCAMLDYHWIHSRLYLTMATYMDVSTSVLVQRRLRQPEGGADAATPQHKWAERGVVVQRPEPEPDDIPNLNHPDIERRRRHAMGCWASRQ